MLVFQNNVDGSHPARLQEFPNTNEKVLVLSGLANSVLDKHKHCLESHSMTAISLGPACARRSSTEN